jgi:TolB-like protein/Tfp pilus assembly protein PilF
VLAIAQQIVAALAAAHAEGIIHRDLKPGNVMVTPSGQVKMLDFGVARLVVGPSEEVHSGTTTVATRIGTLAYMAPEQLFGSDVDVRADVYAAGVMLFQMTTGRLPFEETESAALAQRVLAEPPPRPSQIRSGVSTQLDQVILRCLEKTPDRRYANVDALADDLRALAERRPVSAAPAAVIDSLVVLPLANLSGDPAQEYFADGMTDTLIATLTEIGALRVISRTSAMRYKGASQPLPEIAHALRVAAVIEGTVQRSADRVRITARLVDAAGDRVLWSKTYERELADVLAMQSEVAQSIADEIRVRVTPEEHARLSRAREVVPRALEAYLEARYHWGTRTPDGLRRSVELFQTALERQPTYSAAWAGLADAWNLIGMFRLRRPSEAFPMARSAAARALALEPEMAEAQTALAFASHYFGWDWNASETGYRRTIAQNPGFANAHHWYADFLSSKGRTEEGLAAIRRARELDPLSPPVAVTEGHVLYFARRFEEALAQIYAQRALFPEFAMVHLDLGRALEEVGRFDEARASFEHGGRLMGADPGSFAPLAQLAARSGNTAKAETIVGRLIEARKQRYVSPYTIATVLTAIGDRDRAFEWMEKALEERDPMMTFLMVHPRLDPLRGDVRFDALVRRVGLLR